MKQTKAVLWDLDGTLADSREQHWISWRDTMRAAGFDVTYAQFIESFGQRNDAIVPGWLGARSTPELAKRIGDDKEALYRLMIARDGIVPLPGAAEWVARLRAQGWKQAIASSAPKLNVHAMAHAIGLAPLMDALVSAELVRAGKPSPDVFLAAADALGVPTHRCVVVEDAAVGVEAAHRAGMKCIGTGDPEAVRHADVIVKSLDEIPLDAFERLLAQ